MVGNKEGSGRDGWKYGGKWKGWLTTMGIGVGGWQIRWRRGIGWQLKEGRGEADV